MQATPNQQQQSRGQRQRGQDADVARQHENNENRVGQVTAQAGGKTDDAQLGIPGRQGQRGGDQHRDQRHQRDHHQQAQQSDRDDLMPPRLEQVTDQMAGHRMAMRPEHQAFQPPAAAAGGELVDDPRDPEDKPDAEHGQHQQQHEPPGQLGGQIQRRTENHAGHEVNRRPQNRGRHRKGNEYPGPQAQHAGQHRHHRSHDADEATHENTLAAML